MSEKVVYASEIAEYVFCHRAWWLHVSEGYESENKGQLEVGSGYHIAHGRLLWRAVWGRRVALALVFMAVAAFVFWLVSAL